MTNNHVIESSREAEGSFAEFDFEEGGSTRRVALNPERVFITNQQLDYTIVGCDDQGLENIEPIPLKRNPAMVTEEERVSIIQHPRARRKEVTLHDNRVTDLLDRVLSCLLYTSPSPRDATLSRMPSSA